MNKYRAAKKGYISDSEEEEEEEEEISYRMSDNSQPASPSTSSYNKMSVDSEDASSIASVASEKIQPTKQINHISKIPHSLRLIQDETLIDKYKGSLREKRDPERRNVQRRSSLLPKSKALLRVIDQADEDTRLSDIEMRREKDLQLKIADTKQDVPAASWTKVMDFPYYQCSKLNPEVEMTVGFV